MKKAPRSSREFGKSPEKRPNQKSWRAWRPWREFILNLGLAQKFAFGSRIRSTLSGQWVQIPILATQSIPLNPANIATLGIIAGNGSYPLALAKSARNRGVGRIVATGFENETDPALAALVDEIEWMRVGQLGRMIRFFQTRNVTEAIMAGQIAPGNLFDLRPDMKALLLLAKLRRRNAESIFGAIGEELAKVGVCLLSATTFMEEFLAGEGVFAGPKLSRREDEDVRFGFQIAKEMSRLDIGQTVVVKGGTVLAVEGFDGTNATIRRGGQLGRKDSVVVKVSKPRQDLRFDVPVIGAATLDTAVEARIRVIAVEAGLTLVLEPERVAEHAARVRISLVGVVPSSL